MHKHLHIPFKCELDGDKFLEPAIFTFPEELPPSGNSTKVTITQWIQIIYQDTSKADLLLLFYPRYLSGVELLWLFYSYIKQNEENLELINKFNNIIQIWIKLNYHHEWCCIQEETIHGEDKTKKYPKTNLKTEAIKLVNNETNHLIHSKFPCNFNKNEEEEEFIIIEPKSLFDYSESQIVEQMSLFDVRYLKQLKAKEILHSNNWTSTKKQIISPSITKIVEEFNKFSLYFASFILNFETAETRALCISKLIDIAHFACFNEKIPNFNLAMIIYSSINRADIHRLKKTFAMVHNMNKFKEIDELLTTNSCNNNYRRRVREIDSGIIFFGTFLADITFLWDGRQFTKLNSNVLTFNLEPIQLLHSVIVDTILRPCRNINDDILVKNLNLQKIIEFSTVTVPSDSDLYNKSLQNEPRQVVPGDVGISTELCSICDKILNFAQTENYFSVKEKYVIALLPKTGIEQCYSVLKKLSKKKLTILCSSMQNLLVEFGESFFRDNELKESLDYRILLIHFDARIIFVAKQFGLKHEPLQQITNVCPVKSFQKSARK